jgi:hypothetical protein
VQWLIEEIEPVLSTFDGASQFQVIAGTRSARRAASMTNAYPRAAKLSFGRRLQLLQDGISFGSR